MKPGMNTLAAADRRKALRARLARVEGQVRGLQRLIEAETDDEKVAQQMAAARKALDKAFFAMVAGLIADGQADADAIAKLLLRFG